VFSDAKNTSKSKFFFVKVESIAIEISESVHWTRRCYAISFISVWNEILLGSQGTVNQTTSYQDTLSKKTSAAHWRGTCDLIHTHPKSYPCFITAIKHGYRCLLFLNPNLYMYDQTLTIWNSRFNSSLHLYRIKYH